ncbi:tat pathway signal sequence [Chlorella sorokiniana]|uniref:Tat pathway signal sequence n=1 Tax=Chlorella sorokiniana TaxID=3076 RepID=A0A2P6TFI3_CHLSO|nr:tat pathway signal sequence [Chlorella sorokiniana]|eukprot:PRW32876.1 tat pathway signal sequence [Chlorella sorokiniana]
MASTHHLLRALADRPDELALLLRSEYRPRQTLLHHAAAVGDAALADALLAYDPSLAQVEWEEGSIYYCKPWANAPMAAVASLQPAAVRTLLPHSWPPHQQQQQQPGEKQQPSGTSSSSGGTSAGLGGGRQAPPTDARTFQVGLLARLLHSIAAWEEWPSWQCGIGYKDWQEWPAPPQPRPAALRQQAEATLVALLEGPQGVDINTTERRCREQQLMAA